MKDTDSTQKQFESGENLVFQLTSGTSIMDIDPSLLTLTIQIEV